MVCSKFQGDAEDVFELVEDAVRAPLHADCWSFAYGHQARIRAKGGYWTPAADHERPLPAAHSTDERNTLTGRF